MKKIAVYCLTMLIILSSLTVTAFAESDTSLEIKAKAAVLMDASTGKVLYSHNEHERLYPASVTKIMPLLLVMEAIDSGKISLNDQVTVSADAASKGGSQIWLEEGESMTVDEMLRAVAIASANDACCALGEHISGSESAFVDLMNHRAKELGMNDTHFDNCSGLDDDTETHLTSAYDIAVMSKELLKHELIKKYSTVWMDSLRDGKTELVNTNKLVRFYNGTTGLKTGTTAKAGKCLSASAERDGLHLVAVVLGSETSDDRFNTAKTLLNYGFANYETVELQVDTDLITDVKVLKGIEESIKPTISEIGKVTLKKGDKDKISTEITLATDVEAPVEEGQKLGNVVFKINNEPIGECDLFSDKNIRKIKYTDILMLMLKSLTTGQ
ncbi:MAG: D-alanyl-D-alanine carboxypeptidase [Clostridia bacterium]|nr:D-alanyl-D-alanine carboxypeptidase [Clostridia bacterium]